MFYSKMYTVKLIGLLEHRTQGDTGAMGMYACSLIPLVQYMKHRHNTPNKTDHQPSDHQPSDVKQVY